jgi:hypothetical protein
MSVDLQLVSDDLAGPGGDFLETMTPAIVEDRNHAI